jgi:hypothetical protein
LRKTIALLGPPVIRRYDDETIGEDMDRIGTIEEAVEITGGVSKPSKMLGYAINTPASECKVGSRLQENRGAVWERYYALTNRYLHPDVLATMRRRFGGLFKPAWTPAMALTINNRQLEHLRWHDSGDLRSAEHLLNIVTVAKHTPSTPPTPATGCRPASTNWSAPPCARSWPSSSIWSCASRPT